MKIELQHLPDRDLSPNKRLHHIPVYKAKRAAKEEMMWLVLEHGVPKEPMQKARIDITFVASDKRRRDLDNLFASMKPYIDGLVEVGLLWDDSADRVTYTIRYELGEKPNTIISIQEVKSEIY
jgi:Holliday junction resolvase RusA-like endonuclease